MSFKKISDKFRILSSILLHRQGSSGAQWVFISRLWPAYISEKQLRVVPILQLKIKQSV